MLVLLAVIWGGSVPLTKLGLRSFSPLTLTALRYLVAAPCFAAMLRGRPLPPPRAVAQAAGLGLLGIVVGQLAQTLGVADTSASVATVISALIPVLVVVFGAARLHQPLGGRQALGLAVAFVGVALVATGDPRRLAEFTALAGAGRLRGDLLMGLSAVAVALYYVLSVPLVARYSVVTIAALTSLAGAAGLAPVAWWDLRRAPAQPTALDVLIVLYLDLFVTVFGMWVWFGALSRLPVRIAAALQYLQPLVGVGASAALFGDVLGAWFWAGTGLVLIGIAATASARRGAMPTGASGLGPRPAGVP